MLKSANQVTAQNTGSGIIFIIKTVLISYIISLVLLFVISIPATYRAFSGIGISIAANTVTALATLFAGFTAGRHFASKGIVFGAICGVFYTLPLCIAGSLISGTALFGQNALIALGIGLICGGIGGIVGINTKRTVRR